MRRVSQMIAGNGIPSRLADGILKSNFHIEEARKIKKSKQQQKEYGDD